MEPHTSTEQAAGKVCSGGAILFVIVMSLYPLGGSESVVRVTSMHLALDGTLAFPASSVGRVDSTDCFLLNNSTIDKWVTSVYSYSVNSSSNPNTPSEATAELNIANGWAYVCPLPEFVTLLKDWSTSNFSFQLAVNGATGTGIGKFLELWYSSPEDLDYQEYWNDNIENGQVCGPYLSMWGPPPIVQSQVPSISSGHSTQALTCTSVSNASGGSDIATRPGMILVVGLVVGVGAGVASVATAQRRARFN